MPSAIVIAGPNGAGKTSFVRSWYPSRGEGFTFVNADEIARDLAGAYPPGPARDFAAGRIMIERLDQLSRQGANILVETTLSTRIYVRWIEKFERGRLGALRDLKKRLEADGDGNA